MKAAKLLQRNRSITHFGRTYEHLSEFNRHCGAALGLIELLGQERLVTRTEQRCYRALLAEIRALVSQTVMENLGVEETSAAAQSFRERQKLEKQLQR